MVSLLIGGHPKLIEKDDEYFKLKESLLNRNNYTSEVVWCLGDLHRHLEEDLGYEYEGLEISHDILTLYFKGLFIKGLCKEFVYKLSLVEGLVLEFNDSNP